METERERSLNSSKGRQVQPVLDPCGGLVCVCDNVPLICSFLLKNTEPVSYRTRVLTKP